MVVLWIVILACNTFIVVFSDSTLDMSVLLSLAVLCFKTPWKYQSTEIILIVVLPCSICLDSPFNFGISWQFC